MLIIVFSRKRMLTGKRTLEMQPKVKEETSILVTNLILIRMKSSSKVRKLMKVMI